MRIIVCLFSGLLTILINIRTKAVYFRKQPGVAILGSVIQALKIMFAERVKCLGRLQQSKQLREYIGYIITIIKETHRKKYLKDLCQNSNWVPQGVGLGVIFRLCYTFLCFKHTLPCPYFTSVIEKINS